MEDAAGTTFRVLAAFHRFRTPARVRDALLDHLVVDSLVAGLSADGRAAIEAEVGSLTSAGVRTLAVDEAGFPARLFHRGRAMVPALFYSGNIELLREPCVSVSGSRDVSDAGASAATRLGEIMAAERVCLVAGNARGVDSLAARSALMHGGRSILVLPEGITCFRPSPTLERMFTATNHLIVSQFPPGQKWATRNAMARNRVICGLGEQLIVVEARERGGSLAAGREALKLNKPVLALTYGRDEPRGNAMLIEDGAAPIDTPQQLRYELAKPWQPPEQGTLL
ncbi:DNA-processing protein DprA [Gordonia sp. DT218]|uniref:DNA-processing protein DprA n=1 Tax=Gordonia sp. DT218 TaxID=3416659 RepID=UPI003CF5020A